MKFKIGDIWTVEVFISRSPQARFFDLSNGTSRMDIVDITYQYWLRKLYITHSFKSFESRLDAVLRGLARAWMHHQGRPTAANMEEWIATFTASMMSQFIAQGGEAELMSLAYDPDEDYHRPPRRKTQPANKAVRPAKRRAHSNAK